MVNAEKYRLQLEARLEELKERLVHIEEELVRGTVHVRLTGIWVCTKSCHCDRAEHV